MPPRTSVSYSFAESELQVIKSKMLNWLRRFSIFAYLDNNGYRHKPNRYELLLAAGAEAQYAEIPPATDDWLFGHIAYDYKNRIEDRLRSRHAASTGFEEVRFFCPQIVMALPYDSLVLEVSCLGYDPESVLQELLDMPLTPAGTALLPDSPVWQPVLDRQAYLERIAAIKEHIAAGDCYEMNFCTGAQAQAPGLDPVSAFARLNTLNPSPFAALYRNEAAWLLCASPERFLFREGDRLLSQPIKGTARRSSDPLADGALKQRLYEDDKERAENVMIVDLVRNDLARSCRAGSIEVPELFGVYSFPQVHQLISTVSGLLRAHSDNASVIRHAFPMGSMTGAPKFRVMELTDELELMRRELYAGSVGYMTPGGDFDFNVVIRSLLYREDSGRLAYQTGGAITYASDPAAEWEEVRLKAHAMEQIFL